VQPRGLPSSGQELAELKAGIAAGKSDEEILASFAAKYGATGAGRAHWPWF